MEPVGPSPELNDIERTFRIVKHRAMPQHTITGTKTLTAAGETVVRQVNSQLLSSK